MLEQINTAAHGCFPPSRVDDPTVILGYRLAGPGVKVAAIP